MKRFNRHDLYYRLMDVALIAQLIMIVDKLWAVRAGAPLLGVSGAVTVIVGSLGFVVPGLLIFQRWMRDDYSEMLWQRTAGTVLKLLILLPIPVAIAAGYTVASGGQDEAIRIIDQAAPGGQIAVKAMVLGVVQSAVYLWLATPVLFTFAFQGHRWRASR